MALAPQEPRPAAQSSGSGRPTRSGPVILEDRYRFEPGTPLITLDTPSAKAYEVEDLRDATRKLFALICTPALPPRANAMAILSGSSAEGMLPLVEWSDVYWPPLKKRCMAVVYERPVRRGARAPSHQGQRYSRHRADQARRLGRHVRAQGVRRLQN